MASVPMPMSQFHKLRHAAPGNHKCGIHRGSAAAVLETIDEGQDAERARAAVSALTLAVHDCRVAR
ncbi:hypothetical protein [Streptomyces collinus]